MNKKNKNFDSKKLKMQVEEMAERKNEVIELNKKMKQNIMESSLTIKEEE